MTVSTSSPAIVQAAQNMDSLQAALAYQALGLSVLPLKGKRPALKSWAQYQNEIASQDTVEEWNFKGLLENVGIVCGAVSGKLVVIDFDGLAAYAAFCVLFPSLAETFTVKTGSGQGMHMYLYVDDLPVTTKAMDTPIGHIELRSDGCQVAAPPSLHPKTGMQYEIEKRLAIQRVDDLDEVVAWIESFKSAHQAKSTWKPPRNLPAHDNSVNPDVIEAIASRLRQGKYRERGDWLNCSCVYPERHQNGDKHPSFGLNLSSGYAYCYKCGTILAKDLCEALGIDPAQYGGLMQAEVPALPISIKKNGGIPAPRAETVDLSSDLPSLSDITLPDWLMQYTDWATRIGNQTPVMFHQAAGIWLLSVAIARRLYVSAPWGVKLWPNLYMMFVADTTFYRKTTAFKLAESVIRETIPHMLMPTPGSPERFQEALAGRLPGNFKELTHAQQSMLAKARGFAAQRGLFKDEVAGLFGAFNKKDYMFGLKDLIMELYDCPDYSDKDTQSGLTIVENAALSILGVTTPAGLSTAISGADWANGLLPRFLLLTPEPDYEERPTLAKYELVPESVLDGLKTLHEKLPMPQKAGEGWKSPQAQVSMIPLEPHQEAALDTFTQRFAERVNDHNPTFDSSTVAKWSRDPIPELEHAVLEYFKPVRRMARDGTIHRMTVSRPAQSGLSERATLAALVEQFESGPLLLHYAFALHTLNDYDRRMQNEDRNFRAQGRVVFAICAFVIGVVTLLLVPLWVELSEWQAAVQGIMVFVGSSLTVILTVLAVIQIRLGTVASTDHITRTRSDIQTLQQLID